MILHPTPVSTDRFTFAEGVLAAEASDLPDPSRVYDDACDVGYTVISHRTGREVVYAQHETVRNATEVRYWIYMPVRHTDPQIPVHIFND